MSFPRYPEYKDSDARWLNSVPEHWRVSRLSHGAETIVPMRDKPTDLTGDIPWVRIEDFAGKYISSSKSGQGVDVDTVQSMRLKVFPEGTVLCSCSCNMGRTAIAASRLISNQTFIGLSPNQQLYSDYLFYLMQGAQEELTSLGTGAIQQYLSQDDFRALRIPYPSFREQQKISQFLDHETARIDALVAEQQRLIELLKEKRQAVISYAVTKGLDPGVPMQDSGVEWLGKIPTHWGAARLKNITLKIVDCPHETPIYDPDGKFLVVRTADLEQGVLDPESMYRVDEPQYVSRIRRSPLYEGDIVYGREGERWGHAALVPESFAFCLGQRMMQFRIGNSCCPEYMMWQLNSRNIYRQGDVDVVGATSPHVNVSTIKNYFLTVPPMHEQKEIANFLNLESERFDTLAREAESTILLLKERRATLISAAVTGKIDVRNWQAPAESETETFSIAAEPEAAYEVSRS